MREVKKGEAMKLAIIFPDKEGWTVDQFRESAKKRGAEVQTIEVTDELIAKGQVDAQIQRADVVLWKFAEATLAGFLASYPILKDKPLINTGVVLMPSATDKFLQQQLIARSPLAEYAVTTYRVRDREHTEELVREGLLSYPLVIKPAWGTNAQNICIITTADDLNKVGVWHSQIAEPFIPSLEEWRVFVVGGVVAGIMKKRRKDGADPDSTIIGGGARNVAEEDTYLSARLADIAERVASLFHLEYAGIDIVRDSHTGSLHVYEANSAAGWQNGFVEATGEDIPAQVLDWFEERLSFQRHGDVSRSVRKYLNRRAHRLPLLDQLLLTSLLMEVYPKESMLMRRQQLMGEDYALLRQAVRDELDSGLRGTAFIRELLDILCRHHTVEPRKILGDVLYEQITAHEVEKKPEDEVTVETLAEWVEVLHARKDSALVPIIDGVIQDNFAQIPLAILIKFAVYARLCGGPSGMEALILGRAKASVSWAGNFIIDESEVPVGVSTGHTLRQGYLQSAYYVWLEALIEKADL